MNFVNFLVQILTFVPRMALLMCYFILKPPMLLLLRGYDVISWKMSDIFLGEGKQEHVSSSELLSANSTRAPELDPLDEEEPVTIHYPNSF
tara:strand:+ start:1958 stop:2230 length:273 start_codon:yes stop_codon:yes gene_type:complete